MLPTKKRRTIRIPTVISLFSGIGGLDLGFKDAGFDIVKAIELKENLALIYKANVGPIECADLTRYDLSTLTNCDVVIGGPPCQGFSVAGKMDPSDRRSRLIFTYLKIVERVKPKVWVMENVPHLYTSSKFAAIRAEISNKSSEMGYTVTTWKLNAKLYGVPQSRERVFYVGTQCGHTTPSQPVETTPDVPITAGSVLRALPQPGEDGNERVCKAKIVFAKNPVLRGTGYAGMLFNGQGRPINLDSVCNTLPASMGGNKTPIVDEEHLRKNEEPWIPIYHTYLTKGIGEKPAAVPSRLRRITPREAACLQGFPRDFILDGSNSTIYKGIGNSVPPPLATAVATAIFATFDKL